MERLSNDHAEHPNQPYGPGLMIPSGVSWINRSSPNLLNQEKFWIFDILK